MAGVGTVFGHTVGKQTVDGVMSSPVLNQLPSPTTPQVVPVDGLVKAYSMLEGNAQTARSLEADSQALKGLDNVIKFAQTELDRLGGMMRTEGPPVPSLHAAPPPAPPPAAPPAGLGATPVAPSPIPPGAVPAPVGA